MATGTKIRALSRLLDANEAPLWAISPSGVLIYLSAGCAKWLGVDLELLIDRRSVAGAPVSDDPLDQLAASLSPPVGLTERGSGSLKIQPPIVGEHRPEAIEVRFTRVGAGDSCLIIAVGGLFDDRSVDLELRDAVAIRQRLDGWRRRHAALATIAATGQSIASRRLRRRLKVAAKTRTDIGFFGRTGCGNESLALRVHQVSSPGESIVIVDGPLMDAELLDATLSSLVHQLTESSDAEATVLVRDLDEMPAEAQARLVALLETFLPRLRLLGLCGPRPAVLLEALDEESLSIDDRLADRAITGLCPDLIEILSALTVENPPLASRVDDVPMMATALLDARRAAGESSVAERISRAALDSLVVYPWPGNFDELDQAIRHAIRRSTGTSIGIEHLPLAVRSFRPGEDPARIKSKSISLDDAVSRYEQQLIQEALDAVDGNRAEAARQLGISRARLLRKIDAPSKSDHD
ncbi:MAG: helix-turn-helix domain-containing protein [Rubripirellula sp.]